jgi:hypothetical protein
MQDIVDVNSYCGFWVNAVLREYGGGGIVPNGEPRASGCRYAKAVAPLSVRV